MDQDPQIEQNTIIQINDDIFGRIDVEVLSGYDERTRLRYDESPTHYYIADVSIDDDGYTVIQ